jgi:hypothetical protein
MKVNFNLIKSVNEMDLFQFSAFLKKHCEVVKDLCRSDLRFKQCIVNKLEKLQMNTQLKAHYLQFEK